MKEEILYSGNDSFKINQISEILKQNDILYVLKTNGAGQYINITMGQTIEETNILVDAENSNKANELIAVLKENSQDKEISKEEKNIIL